MTIFSCLRRPSWILAAILEKKCSENILTTQALYSQTLNFPTLKLKKLPQPTLSTHYTAINVISSKNKRSITYSLFACMYRRVMVFYCCMFLIKRSHKTAPNNYCIITFITDKISPKIYLN